MPYVKLALGEVHQALFCFQKALVILEKVYGNEHPHVIANRKYVITATYQTIEYPQQQIAFVLAEYTKRQNRTN